MAEYFELSKNKKYVSSVDKAYMAKFIDPLSLNFKLLVNYNKTSGLLADEKYENSALAYLKRTGEELRYIQLRNWIYVFEKTMRDFDFQLLDVEGLDLVINQKPENFHNEIEDKVNFIFSETTDMLFIALVENYRHIVFDDVRKVEVVPSNLTKFDISVLIFSSGYFDMDTYDDGGESNVNYEKILFPTKRKLADSNYLNKLSEKYNHLLVNFGSCKINIEESGKNFIETISNNPGGDTVKTNISLNYKFSNYRGRFNNSMGDFDFVGLLAIMSAQNKAVNKSPEIKKTIKDKLKENLKKSKDSLIKSTTKTLETKASNQIKKLTSSVTPIGDILSKLNIEHAEMLLKNTIDVGINYIEDKFINDPLTKINNMVMKNFSSDLLGLYDSFNEKSPKSNVKLIENNPNNNTLKSEGYQVQEKLPTGNPIELRNENVFNRKSF